MNVFDPRSFSTDWEILVIDKLNRCVGMDKLMGFAGVLGAELDLPIQIDWNSLEFALGINTSFAQLWQRIQCATDRAAQMLREYDLELYPSGSHPIDPMFNSSHIHVGTIHDESAGIHLENQIFRYVPVFAALAANSPVAPGQRGAYKSYRVRYQANGCTRPWSVRDPQLSQRTWGSDAAPKVYGAPTLEVRIPDCASSRRFKAEFTTFVAAFVHEQGTKVAERQPTPEEYQEFLINRWAAARHGLQATFRWGGGSRPVVEILDEMLDACGDALRVLGASRTDFTLIDSMRTKRFCQADFALDVAKRYPDPYGFASAYSKLIRHWEVFDDYLSTAPTLEPAAAPDDDMVLAEHLSYIGEGTHFYRSRDAMYFPPSMADAMVERLVQQGAVERTVTPDRGMVLSRVR